MNTNEVNLAISNMEALSSALEKAANKQEKYNTDWGHYLEQLSWDMYRNAQEMKEKKYLFGE